MSENKNVALLVETLFQAKLPYNRTRIQKMAFLGKVEEKLPYTYEFLKHYHGPFARGVAETIFSLTEHGILEEKKTDHGNNVIEYSYRLTPLGIKLRENPSFVLTNNEKEKITRLSEKYDKMSLMELISSIYSNYMKIKPIP